MAEDPTIVDGPGGQFTKLIGAAFNTTTPTITNYIHHVITTAAITTITPPYEGFAGPVWLIADSIISWTTSGNIAGVAATTLVANSAYGFVYEKLTGKWHAIGISY